MAWECLRDPSSKAVAIGPCTGHEDHVWSHLLTRPQRLPPGWSSESPAGLFPAPPRAIAHNAGWMLHKEGTQQSSGIPRPRGCIPQGERMFFFTRRFTIHLPSHIQAGLHLARTGTFWYFIQKEQGLCPSPGDSASWVEKSLFYVSHQVGKKAQEVSQY